MRGTRMRSFYVWTRSRASALAMLIEPLSAEAMIIERRRGGRDEMGTAAVRSGLAEARKLTLGAGRGNLCRGSMTAGVTSTVTPGASPATSCRPACAAHPRSPRWSPIFYLRGWCPAAWTGRASSRR